MTQVPSGLGPGERAPDFVAPRADGTMTRLYARAGGRPALLLFAPAVDAAVTFLLQRLGDRCTLHLVVPESLAPPEPPPGTDLFRDDGAARAAYRLPADASAHAVLLDRSLRAVASMRLGGPAAQADDAAHLGALVDDLAASAPARTVTGQAPVLFVPRLLEPALCAHLQQVWAGAHEETGMERSGTDGRRPQLDADAKRRRDHVVADAGLLRALTQTVGRRVLPEVRRLFGYGADRFEGFKIACYEADAGGFFHAHRDNLSPATAHRRFALSVNLNDGYDGGELRFPEYGDDLYRPAAGEGLVFACSMLHEVVPVTAGQRFALLSFLFGGEARRTRPA